MGVLPLRTERDPPAITALSLSGLWPGLGSGLPDGACSGQWEYLGLNPILLLDLELSGWLGNWTDLALSLSTTYHSSFSLVGVLGVA